MCNTSHNHSSRTQQHSVHQISRAVWQRHIIHDRKPERAHVMTRAVSFHCDALSFFQLFSLTNRSFLPVSLSIQCCFELFPSTCHRHIEPPLAPIARHDIDVHDTECPSPFSNYEAMQCSCSCTFYLSLFQDLSSQFFLFVHTKRSIEQNEFHHHEGIRVLSCNCVSTLTI